MVDKLIRTIKAISVRKKEEGSIGFLTLEEENHWFNMNGDPSVLDEWLKSTIQKGNLVEFEMENGFVTNLKLKQKAPEKEEGNWADDMTNFEDLLTAAHEKAKKEGKLFSIETKIVQDGDGKLLIDYANKRALFQSEITIEDIKTGKCEHFTGHGDAEGISSESIKPHFIRMAETRSIVRALRWYTNNAQVAVEETGGKPAK